MLAMRPRSLGRLSAHYTKMLLRVEGLPHTCRFNRIAIITSAISSCEFAETRNEVRSLLHSGDYEAAVKLGSWDPMSDAVVWYVAESLDGDTYILEANDPFEYALETEVLWWWRVEDMKRDRLLLSVAQWFDLAPKPWWKRMVTWLVK